MGVRIQDLTTKTTQTGSEYVMGFSANSEHKITKDDFLKEVNTELENKVDEEEGKSLVSDEDIAQITTNKNDIADLETAITLKADKTQTNETDRRLNNLYKLTEGQVWDFDTNDENSYIVDIPSGSVNAEVLKLGGKGLVYNQLVQISSLRDATTIGITQTNNQDGTITLSGTSTGTGTLRLTNNTLSDGVKLIKGHKHLVMFSSKLPSDLNLNQFSVYQYNSDGTEKRIDVITQGSAIIDTSYMEDNGYITMACRVLEGSTVNAILTLLVVDLTLMFGGNEPTLSDIQTKYPELLSYRTYDTGTVKFGAVDKVLSRSKKFNQLVQNGNFESTSGWTVNDTTFVVNNNTAICTATAVSTSSPNKGLYHTGVSLVNGHKYYMSAKFKLSADGVVVCKFASNRLSGIADKSVSANQLSNFSGIGTSNYTGSATLIAYGTAQQIGDKIEIKDVMCVDLTAIFGAGNEPTIEIIQSKYPHLLEWHEYSEGYYTLDIETPIPNSIKNLEGYGWSAGSVYNYVDFENKKYHKYLTMINLGQANFDWQHSSSNSYFYANVNIRFPLMPYGSEQNILSNKYNAKKIMAEATFNEDKTIAFLNSDGVSFWIYINDFDYTSSQLQEFKNSLNNVWLIYPLATETAIDITDKIEDFNVEGNGTITFHNPDDLSIPVPSTTEYIVKLLES